MGLTVVIKLLLLLEVIEIESGFVFYTLILITYLSFETSRLWMMNRRLFFINPVVLASLSTFILSVGVSNIVYALPSEYTIEVWNSQKITPWMNELMFLANIAACAMWIGYDSPFGSDIARVMERSSILNRWIRTSNRVNLEVLYLAIIVSFVARLILMNLGLYGFTAGDTNIEQIQNSTASFSAYLLFASGLGNFALIAVAIQVYSSFPSTNFHRASLGFAVCYEAVFAVLSGFKGAIVLLILSLVKVYYAQRDRFPIKYILTACVALALVYPLIEPYRETMKSLESSSRSVGDIVDKMVTSFSSESFKDSGTLTKSVLMPILARVNLTYDASLGIEYAATIDRMPSDSPKFLENIFLAPLHAIIPRFLWDNKPFGDLGLWYTNEVLGLNFYSYTAMSPFTYLNFAGGPVAVIFGFLFVGVVQRSLFDGLAKFGGGGLFIFFGMLYPITTIDNAFNSLIIDSVRNFPILLFLQYWLFRSE